MTEVNQKPLSYLVKRTKLNVDLHQVEPDVRKNYQKLSSQRDKAQHRLPSNRAKNYLRTRSKEEISMSTSVKPSQRLPLYRVRRTKFQIHLTKAEITLVLGRRKTRSRYRSLWNRVKQSKTRSRLYIQSKEENFRSTFAKSDQNNSILVLTHSPSFSIASTLTSVPSYQMARLIKNPLSSSYAEFTSRWPFFQLRPAFSRHVHAGIQKRTRLLGERGREGGKRRRKSTRKRKEKGKTVNRCQSTVVPEWSSEMAFGFPAASVAAAAPLSLLSIASAAFYVDTWLHVCARESARQFFFSPRIDRVTLYAFPPPIPPGGRPFPTTCTCSWNTRTRATAANAFAGKCLPLTRYSHDYASILRVKDDSKERDIFQFVWKWHDFVMGSDELRNWVWACCAIVWNKGSCCFFAMVRVLVREEEFKIFGLFGKEVCLWKEISYEF